MTKSEQIEVYRNRYGDSAVKELYKADKTPTKKYVGYIGKQYLILSINLYEISQLIQDFDEHLPYILNKDIYSSEYLDINNLRSVVTKAILKKQLKQNKKKKASNIFMIKETDDYILFQPRTHEASRKYGYGTTWCTTYSERIDYFLKYRDHLVYLIYKNPGEFSKLPKVAFHYPDGKIKYLSIYDPQDYTIGKNYFLENVENGKKILKLVKNFNNRNKWKWFKMLNTKSITSRYEKLYG